MNPEADARFALFRLQELLVEVPLLFRLTGVRGPEADVLSDRAAELGRDLLALRQAATARPLCPAS